MILTFSAIFTNYFTLLDAACRVFIFDLRQLDRVQPAECSVTTTVSKTDGAVLPVHVLAFQACNITLTGSQMPAQLIFLCLLVGKDIQCETPFTRLTAKSLRA